jgi:hypothetical protein
LSGLFFHYTQDNLATRVSFRSLLVRLACLGKGQHRLDDRSNLSCINQRANLDQLLPIRFNNKPGKARVMPLCYISRGAWADDGDQHSSWFHHLPGALQGVTTHRIEDDIDRLDHLLEACGDIVDDLGGSQFVQEVTIACRGGRDDLCPSSASQLDGKDSHASCRTVDQDGLPCNEVRMFKEGLPGRQR